RERYETADLIGDDRQLQAFLPAQRFDQREADERCVAEAADQRQRADPFTRPTQQTPEQREESPGAQERQPERNEQKPQSLLELELRNEMQDERGQRDV